MAMKLVRFDVTQHEGFGYLRQVECRFADDLRPDSATAEYIAFRVGIEFEDEPGFNDCLVNALRDVRDVIVEEIKRRAGTDKTQ